MDYPIRTISQLRPILQGFRKAAGMTQARMADLLGVTQQAYAQLEANPAAASVERVFKVLRLLDVDMTLSQNEARRPTDEQGDLAPPATASATPRGRAPMAQAERTSKPRREPRTSGTLRTAEQGPDDSRGRTKAPHEKTTAARNAGTGREPARKRVSRPAGAGRKKRENW